MASTNVPSPRLRHSSLRALRGSPAVATVGELTKYTSSQAILVEVEDCDASAHGFEDVLLVRRRDVREGDPLSLVTSVNVTFSDARVGTIARYAAMVAETHSDISRGRGLAHHFADLRSRTCGVTSGFVSGTAAVRFAARLRSRLNSASAFSCSAVFPSALYACAA